MNSSSFKTREEGPESDLEIDRATAVPQAQGTGLVPSQF